LLGTDRILSNNTKKKLRKTSLCKKVYQFSKEGNYIKIWNSTQEASRQLKVAQASISRCCNNKQIICGGYKFSFNKLYN